jgi:hypothetical protein
VRLDSTACSATSAERARKAAGQPGRGGRPDRRRDDQTGLTVQCALDEKSYAKGIKLTDAEMATLNLESDRWHPEWNYTIKPQPPGRSGNS